MLCRCIFLSFVVHSLCLVSLHFMHFCMQPVAKEVIKLRSNSLHVYTMLLYTSRKNTNCTKKIFYTITQQCQHKTNKILNALDCMRSIFQCTRNYFVFNDSHTTRGTQGTIGISAKVQTNNGKVEKKKMGNRCIYRTENKNHRIN